MPDRSFKIKYPRIGIPAVLTKLLSCRATEMPEKEMQKHRSGYRRGGVRETAYAAPLPISRIDATRTASVLLLISRQTIALHTEKKDMYAAIFIAQIAAPSMASVREALFVSVSVPCAEEKGSI